MFQAANCHGLSRSTLSAQLNFTRLTANLWSTICIPGSFLSFCKLDLIFQFLLSVFTPHHPKHFSGESGYFNPFFPQSELCFKFNASAFSSDRAKIAFRNIYLTGWARSWNYSWVEPKIRCVLFLKILKYLSNIPSNAHFWWESSQENTFSSLRAYSLPTRCKPA